MAARRTKRDRIIDAAIELAGDQPWEDVTLTLIAARARLPLAELRREFSSRNQILGAFVARIDAEMLAAAGAEDDESTVRDRLFDLIMCRLDALGPFKPALKNISGGRPAGPSEAVAGLGHLLQSQGWILDAAGATTPGLSGKIKTCGLAALYLDVLSVWLEEDDPGLPRTMARLDRQLRRGERLLECGAAPMALTGRFGSTIAACARRMREAAPAAPDTANDAATDA